MTKSVAWRSHTHIDVKDFAKSCTEQLIDSLLKGSDDNSAHALKNTNWVSVCAGIAKHVSDFNESLAVGVTRDLVRSVQ